MPKKQKNSKSKTIDLDNEVIIGLTTKKIEQKKKNKKKTATKKTKKKNKKKAIKSILLRWITLLILLAVAIGLILLSDLFNCKQIVVLGNNKITQETIINLSNIKKEENMFKINTRKVKNSIKQNAYINDAKIKRKLNGIVEIHVEERIATYMLTFEAGCIYINNQGYILEISEEPILLPVIMGLKTELSTKKVGERLEKEDLYVLEKIISITDIANMKGLKENITYINVEDEENIQIYMDGEKKTINFGDEKNASKKFDRIKVILEQEKECEGEIFIKDIENIYFREKV